MAAAAEAFVNAMFSGVDSTAFAGIWFVCTSPVSPPRSLASRWSILGAETNIEDEKSLLERMPEKTNAIVVVAAADSKDESEKAALTGFSRRAAATTSEDPPVILLLPGFGHGRQDAIASTQLLFNSGSFDDVLWDAPTGFALALAIKAKVLRCHAKLKEALEEQDRRAAARAVGDSLLSSVESNCWEYFRSRRLRYIPEKQESHQLGEHGDCVAGFRVGKKAMSWMFGPVHFVAPQAPLATLRDADGEVVENEEARMAPQHAAAVENGEMTFLMVKKRNIKTILGMRMINRYLQVMTDMMRVPHPNLPELVQALHSPDWLYVQLRQRGTHSLFCALKRRDSPQRGVPSKPIQTTVIVDIIDQLGQALRHLHEVADVAHRDIKPEVVMLEDMTGPDGIKRVHATLSGLELATQGRYAHTMCGTMPFFAPELAGLGTQSYDSMKADMWSLGITLLEVACGFRCIEVAICAEDNADSTSAKDALTVRGHMVSSTPCATVADKIKHLFSLPGCIGAFLAKSVPEAEPLQGLLARIFVGLLQVSPQQRFDASELVHVLRF